jgi:RNA polymerase sigma factor (sigma-70 family)
VNDTQHPNTGTNTGTGGTGSTGSGTDTAWLTARFEEHRGHLRAVAYRMLGSLPEAEDAVQEGWLRLNRADTADVHNLGGWLTTVVSRVCLDMLRSRTARREQPFDGYVPDPVITREDPATPEAQAVLADSVGLALLVVLDNLAPAERLAFVLHDMFGVPFEEIAPVVDRTPAAARQLASRARRRVQGAAPVGDTDLHRQRAVIDAFLAAARDGDLDRLVAVLHPDVVLRADQGPARSREVHGAETVAKQASLFARSGRSGGDYHPVLVNGQAGGIVVRDGAVYSVAGFTIVDDRIVEMDILADPARLAQLDLAAILG